MTAKEFAQLLEEELNKELQRPNTTVDYDEKTKQFYEYLGRRREPEQNKE